MRIDESRDILGPITVDERFMRAISRIFADVGQLSVPAVAKSADVSEHIIKALLAGRKPRQTETYVIERANRSIARYLIPNYVIKFDSGLSMQTASIDEIIESVANEPSNPKSFEASIGGYDLLYVNVHADDWFSKSGRFTVKGERASVAPIREALDKAVKNAESEHAYLYGKWPGRWLALLIVLYFTFAYAFAVSMLDTAKYPGLFTSLAGATFLIPGLGMFLAWPIVDRFRAMFPRLQFASGIMTKRRRAQREFWKSLGAGAILPILLIPVAAVIG